MRAGSQLWRRCPATARARRPASVPARQSLCRRSLRAKFEQPLRNSANLDLLCALGDPVAAVMAVDVLERLVAAVTEAAEDLHGPVGGVADQSVGPVIGHRNLVRYLHVVVAVQMPGGVLHQ